MSLYDVAEELKQSLRESRDTVLELNGTIAPKSGFKDLPIAMRSIPRGNDFLLQSLDGTIKTITEADLKEVESLRPFAFAYCANLTSVALSGTVERLGSNAFDHCTNLESVSLPNSLYNIGTSAFAYCESLTSIKIPLYVRYIGSKAFRFCTNCLEYDFTALSGPPTLEHIDAFYGIHTDARIKVRFNSYDDWINATNWANYERQIITVDAPKLETPTGLRFTSDGSIHWDAVKYARGYEYKVYDVNGHLVKSGIIPSDYCYVGDVKLIDGGNFTVQAHGYNRPYSDSDIASWL